MSIPSYLDSQFLSCSDVIENFNGQSVLSSNPFLSTKPVEYPPTHDTDHPSICNFVDVCNFATPAGHSGLSNPVLEVTFCSSSRRNHSQSQGSDPSDKREHKMAERQRRKDMNALMSILRSLLPEGNLQGKRAVPAQVQEAVKYVQHLQRKVEDLSTERDKMKASSDDIEEISLEDVRLSCKDKFCSKAPSIGGSDEEFPKVEIKSIGSDYQVLTNTFEHQIVYSDLLMALDDGGLEVVCAASSAVNSRVYHTIYTKVSDLNIFHVDNLYQKLWHLIRTNHTQHQD
eukprot:PITA_06811